MKSSPPSAAGHAFYDRADLYVETYDARTTGGPGSPVEGDVDFYLDESRRAGGPVLELGCGTGRVSWPLAAAGIELVGLDASPPMLAQARAKAARYGEEAARRISFVEGDMRDFDLDRRFALVLIPFRAFQHMLTVEEQRRCLASIRRHLAEGGRAVIDLFDPWLDRCLPGAAVNGDRGTVVHPRTGNRVSAEVIRRENDPVRQLFDEDWRFVEKDPGGETVREQTVRLWLRWTYRQEARHLFELSGFEVEAEYSDFRRSPPAYGREQVWVLRAAR